jgi:hypothetical protein
MLFFSATLFNEELQKLTDMYVKMPVHHEPAVSKISNFVSPGVPYESDSRVGRKCPKQSHPKERKTKFNRCKRPSE